MEDFWKKVEIHLKKHDLEGYNTLNSPALDQDLEVLENSIGCKLPEDFKSSLKIHNGQKNFADTLFDGDLLLSTKMIADEWQIWKDLLDDGDFEGFNSEPQEGIKDHWWNALWIPITYNGAGDHICIDLDPAIGGKKGQIITMWHDHGERKILAPGFTEWFARFIPVY